MKKLLLLALVLLSIFLGYSFAKEPFDPFDKLRVFDSLRSLRVNQSSEKPKEVVLKIGLVADSHIENDLLAKALRQAQGHGVDFVIGLGDYTNLGTIDELNAAKRVFDQSGLTYYVIPGDRDGWESREKGEDNVANFAQVFDKVQPLDDSRKNLVSSPQIFEQKGIQFVLLDNSDIYKGIGATGWQVLDSISGISRIQNDSRLVFIFAHKTPFHPDSAHVMGEDSPDVAVQAKRFMDLMESHKVDGLFSGDLHFFARFNSPSGSVKITTIGAVASERNFQGPRFAILKVYDDYSWEVEDVEIK